MKKSMFLCAVIITAMLFACKQEHATQFSSYDKYSIANDTNWVEITDIDTVKTCIDRKLYKGGIVVNSEIEYKNLFFETLKDPDYLRFVRNHPDKTVCTEEYQPPPINFDNRILILYNSHHGGGQPVFERKIYKNKYNNEIVYLLVTTFYSETLENSRYHENITIPRFYQQSQIKFDTIFKFKN